MRLIAVTGTNTGVGKTVVTAALTSCALTAGQSVAVVKPAQTGLRPGEPGDLAVLAQLTGAEDLHEYARFAEPLAPGTAARRQAQTGPQIADVTRQILTLTDRDVVLIEGAGGLLVELNSAGQTLLHLLEALRHEVSVEVVLVASAGLGVLNIAALTAQVLHTTALPLTGAIIGSWPKQPDLAARCNLTDLPRYAGTELVGVVPAGAGSLTRHHFTDAAARALTPRLGGTFDPASFIATMTAPAPLEESL